MAKNDIIKALIMLKVNDIFITILLFYCSAAFCSEASFLAPPAAEDVLTKRDGLYNEIEMLSSVLPEDFDAVFIYVDYNILDESGKMLSDNIANIIKLAKSNKIVGFFTNRSLGRTYNCIIEPLISNDSLTETDFGNFDFYMLNGTIGYNGHKFYGMKGFNPGKLKYPFEKSMRKSDLSIVEGCIADLLKKDNNYEHSNIPGCVGVCGKIKRIKYSIDRVHKKLNRLKEKHGLKITIKKWKKEKYGVMGINIYVSDEFALKNFLYNKPGRLIRPRKLIMVGYGTNGYEKGGVFSECPYKCCSDMNGNGNIPHETINIAEILKSNNVKATSILLSILAEKAAASNKKRRISTDYYSRSQ